MRALETLDDDALAAPARRQHWLRTLVRDRKALLGLIVLVVLSLAALLAPWITPYDPNEMMFDMIGAPSWAHPLSDGSGASRVPGEPGAPCGTWQSTTTAG